MAQAGLTHLLGRDFKLVSAQNQRSTGFHLRVGCAGIYSYERRENSLLLNKLRNSVTLDIEDLDHAASLFKLGPVSCQAPLPFLLI